MNTTLSTSSDSLINSFAEQYSRHIRNLDEDHNQPSPSAREIESALKICLRQLALPSNLLSSTVTDQQRESPSLSPPSPSSPVDSPRWSISTSHPFMDRSTSEESPLEEHAEVELIEPRVRVGANKGAIAGRATRLRPTRSDEAEHGVADRLDAQLQPLHSAATRATGRNTTTTKAKTIQPSRKQGNLPFHPYSCPDAKAPNKTLAYAGQKRDLASASEVRNGYRIARRSLEAIVDPINQSIVNLLCCWKEVYQSRTNSGGDLAALREAARLCTQLVKDSRATLGEYRQKQRGTPWCQAAGFWQLLPGDFLNHHLSRVQHLAVIGIETESQSQGGNSAPDQGGAGRGGQAQRLGETSFGECVVQSDASGNGDTCSRVSIMRLRDVMEHLQWLDDERQSPDRKNIVKGKKSVRDWFEVHKAKLDWLRIANVANLGLQL